MKFLLDMPVSPSLLNVLEANGHEVVLTKAEAFAKPEASKANMTLFFGIVLVLFKISD